MSQTYIMLLSIVKKVLPKIDELHVALWIKKVFILKYFRKNSVKFN